MTPKKPKRKKKAPKGGLLALKNREKRKVGIRARVAVGKKGKGRVATTASNGKNTRISLKKKKGASRSYSRTTLNTLFGLSSNQCAFPGCTNPIIVQGRRVTDKAILGQICHIYAVSNDGPRGKPGLTAKERNSLENLILMCGVHHPLVDKLYNDHPAADLFKWKREHEAKALKGTAENLKRQDDIQKLAFIQQLTDAQIEQRLDRLIKGRALSGFSALDEAETLALQVEQSKLSGGSEEVRARALAWCARILSAKDVVRAGALLAASRKITPTPDAILAEAFILAKSDKAAALALLNKQNSTASKSAALRVVANAEGPEAAIAWTKSAGLSIDSFDADGKSAYIMDALLASDWDLAIHAAGKIEEGDHQEYPVLLHSAALANLIVAIPAELRKNAITQVPFEAREFPLGSEADQLAARRAARPMFERISAFAVEMGTVQASNVASDYAMWLGLRDPSTRKEALADLQESMRDPATSLRRLNLALQFGIQIDLKAIEARIDQSVALTGKGTADDAFARFSLAFAQGSHKGVADYIAKHRAQLYEYLQKFSVLGIEIEVLSKAGLIDSAKEKLAEAIGDGLPQRDQEILSRIIAEAQGADPISQRRSAYESTRDLRSLANLCDGLEGARLWQDLLPYVREFFAQTHSVEACLRLAHCLNELHQYGDLYEFLAANASLVEQSESLKTLWAWTLYREGRFGEASSALGALINKEDENARALRVNIAIASGDWESLVDYSNEVWAKRDSYSARELLQTASLSIVVGAPHAKDLTTAATEKEPDSAEVLAAAYFQATQAGWEQNEAVGAWLDRAAEKSGTDGPLKSVSLEELIEQKPEWDKQSANIWDQLRTGRLPVFAAAQLLNRSLLEFYLLPALANPLEPDVRKRGIIYAYNGVRQPLAIPTPNSIAVDLAALVTFAQLGLLEKLIGTYKVIVPHSTLGWLFQERQKATFHQPSQIKDAKAIRWLITNGGLNVLPSLPSPDHKLAREVGPDLAALLSAAKTRSQSGVKTLVVRSAPIHKIGTLMHEEADVSGYSEFICSCSAVIDRLVFRGVLTQQEAQRARAYLKLRERVREGEPTIDDGTEIYLDGLAVSYLQPTGALEKLKLAGLKTYISMSEDTEAIQFVAIDSLGTEQLDAIERIRSILAEGYTSGKVKAARIEVGTEDEKPFKLHPTYGVLTLADKADAIVIDDRYLNQHPSMTMNDRAAPLLCSLDILNQLNASGKLSQEELFAHRTTLRRAGYQLISVTDDELDYHLTSSQVVNGALVETAELRAIRESLLRARMHKMVQIPGELHFLHQTLGSFIRACKRRWLAGNFEDAKAYGVYLLALADVRGWAASAIPGNERSFALSVYAAFALQIIAPPLNADAVTTKAYYEWVEEVYLRPIKDYQPEVFQWIMQQSKELTENGTEEAIRQYEAENG